MPKRTLVLVRDIHCATPTPNTIFFPFTFITISPRKSRTKIESSQFKLFKVNVITIRDGFKI